MYRIDIPYTKIENEISQRSAKFDTEFNERCFEDDMTFSIAQLYFVTFLY